MRSIILFGGTFDPIHNAHLAIAKLVSGEFDKHRITFLPTNIPPYKPQQTITSIENRLSMLKLALADANKYANTSFEIDTSELEQPKYSPSYLTLRKLRQQHGSLVPISFIIGSDSLSSLDSWDNWQELFDLTNFIVAIRPQYNINKMSKELKAQFSQRVTADKNKLVNSPAGHIYLINNAPLDISSTQIRNRIKEQQDISTLLPAEVAKYIKYHQLYTLRF